MDAQKRTRQERKQELLRELSEIQVEELCEQGVFLKTPHYSVIERAANQLGRELAAQTQQRTVREVAAEWDSTAACPTCGTDCKIEFQTREVTSLTGSVELLEPVANCPRCRRSFFPSADGTGPGLPRTDTGTDPRGDAPGG